MLSAFLDNLLRRWRTARAVSRAGAALEAGDAARAIALLEPAYRAAPHDAQLMTALGQPLIAGDQAGAGFSRLESAVRVAPELTLARTAIAHELHYAGRIDLALEHLRAAAEMEPEAAHVRKALLRPLMETCDWAQAARERQALLDRMQAGQPWLDRVTPMDALLLGLPRDARMHSASARSAAIERGRRSAGRLRSRSIARNARIRIAYLSGDFRDHAVTHLMWKLFGRHDRNLFEVHAYSYGRDDSSVHRRLVMEGVDRFVDV